VSSENQENDSVGVGNTGGNRGGNSSARQPGESNDDSRLAERVDGVAPVVEKKEPLGIRGVFDGGQKGEFRPVKKPILTGQKPILSGKKDLTGQKSKLTGQNSKRGRKRDPEKPPAIAKYLYWKPNSYGFSLEKKHPVDGYEYFGFLLPRDWEHMKGRYDEQQIIQAIRAILKLKRFRTIQRRAHSQRLGEKRG